MPRDERVPLIEQIERVRESRVLVYVTGDRPPAGSQLANDALRPLYDHLREMGKVEKLDLFIYSRGGDIDVPWRIASALRRASDTWNVLIPFRANSAATLLSLGADEIVLGPLAELGPIDPFMNLQRQVGQPGGPPMFMQDNIGIEDLMAYVKFVNERAGLSDQEALTASLGHLANRLDPISLGAAYRTHTHIREVAKRMLLSRKQPPTEQTMATIIETLAERVYAHGHAIGGSDALEMGLPVVQEQESELSTLLWDLLTAYEDHLKLLTPIDPITAVASDDVFTEHTVAGVIESVWGLHEFTGELEIRARRQIPPNLSVSMNMPIQLPALPATPQGQAMQAAIQQMLAGIQPQILQAAQQAVQDALKAQAPLLGAEAALRNGIWRTA
jgi:hypothetical protein